MTDEVRTSVEAQEESALDYARGMAACSDTARPAEAKPLPAAVTAAAAETKSPAQWAYERVILYIQNFEEQLDSRHEVAMGFTGADAGVLRIEGIGWFAPDIISFYGTDDEGARMQLVQHVTQLNVVLRALPKAPEQPQARRIGFQLAEQIAAVPAPSPRARPKPRPSKPAAQA